MFLERLDAPTLGTVYYQPVGNNTDMPNCVKYCHDRADESCENTSLKLFKERSPDGFPPAYKWLEESALPTGNEPKIGSVAVFGNSMGEQHVCFIERVNKDGTCLITDSRYDEDKTLRNDRFWRKVDNVVLKVGQVSTLQGVGELLGFQYLPVRDARVERDTNKTQLEIEKTGVRCRISFGKESPVVNDGCYVPVGIYNVIETHDCDGYTWCKIEDNHWVAHDKSWSTLYKASQDSFDEAVDNFVKLVKDDHSKLLQIKQGLSDVQVIIDRLMKL